MTAPADPTLAVHAVPGGAAADHAIALIQDRVGSGAAPRDTAVLARVNSALLPVQVALTEAGIGHSAPLDPSVLQRTGVRTALAYLRLGLDLERIRRDDLLDTLNRPVRKVKSAVLPHLPRDRTVTIAQLERIVDLLDSTHQDRFAGYLDDLRHLAAAIAGGADTAACLRLVRHRIGLGEAMDALDASRTRPEGSSHGDDLDALEQLASLHRDPATFRAWLASRLEVPADPAGVTLSTVHRVKGMEWDHVVVVAVNAGQFPHRLADDVEEERRVFHVAITRCRERLDVVSDRARVSPFVGELTTARAPGGAEVAAGAAGPQTLPRGRRPPGSGATGRALALPGGLVGPVVGHDDGGVIVAASPQPATDPVRVRVPFGAPVVIDGTATTLTPAAIGLADGPAVPAGGPGGRDRLVPPGADPEPDPGLFEALRAWRAHAARTAGVPAYLVFHDRHLGAIAARRPRTLRELAACPGVGPAKLERFGDDLLDVIDTHDGEREPAAGPGTAPRAGPRGSSGRAGLGR